LKSHSQDYFELWSLNDEPDGQCLEQNEFADVQPSHSRSSPMFKYHRPLERSWPPKRDLKTNRHSLEDFNFDIIDIDEQLFYGANLSGIDFSPGEFFERNKKQKNEKFGKSSIKMDNLMDPPLATPETDGSLSDSLSLRGSKVSNNSIENTPKHLKGLLKHTVTLRSDQIAQTDLSFPDPDLAVAEETVAKLFSCDEPMPETSTAIRPHRPLTRALSNGKGKQMAGAAAAAAVNHYNFDEIPMNGVETNGRSTFLNSLSPRQRSPPSGSSTRSGSPLDSLSSPDRVSPIITVIHPKPIRPQPRPLTVILQNILKFMFW
jgi:E3 ubiquitin-protein ligase HECW2